MGHDIDIASSGLNPTPTDQRHVLQSTSDRIITILYATETGNAEEVAERIARLAYRRHIRVHLKNLEFYDKTDLVNESLVIFVISTTGNGEFPSPSRPFWQFLLRSNLPNDILSELNFAVFGLGDSNYARFCWAARMLQKRLQQLGGNKWLEEGEADDQHYLGIEGALDPWLDNLKEKLDKVMPVPSEMEKIDDEALLPPRVYTRTTGAMPKDFSDPTKIHAKIIRNSRITSEDHWQDVRLLEMELDESIANPAYRAGDIACLMPTNSEESVEALMDRLGWSELSDSQIQLENTDHFHPLPEPLASENQQGSLTLRRLLTRYLDPFSVPRRSFFETIAHFSPPDHREHEKLQEFLQPGEGTDDMYEYAQRVRRTMAEVLDEFTSVSIPVEYVMEVFPLLRERQYSIASAPSPTVPILAIGPGTGIAPIRSIVQERIATDPSAIDNTVVLGCRYSNRDFLLKAEWEKLADKSTSAGGDAEIDEQLAIAVQSLALQKPLIKLFVAASRDQPEKVYVQDVLRSQAALVWNILGTQRGIAYLSG
ncbi:NAPDH-dependent diflavin reductase [Malassezia psittaci]|uniref:NAPDH-dependent diflavin reductase n=1 Tax=Malassezia psittaci TaxID=1821823 RepID=A0AAF0FC27_9BASI|nr:NAPDH-dependent diflavin reductase [Malassezia psittaci]